MGKGKASKVKRKEESGLKIDFSPLFFSRDTFEKSEGKGKITWDEKIFKIRLFKMIFPITITRLSCMEEVGFSFRKNKRRRRKREGEAMGKEKWNEIIRKMKASKS